MVNPDDDRPGIARPEPRVIRARVVARHEGDPPFEVDAVAVEEDTFTVLSADPAFSVPEGSLERAAAAAAAAEPLPLGSVVVRPGSPVRLLAVVHDLSQEPTWTEDSVALGLRNALLEAEARGLQAVAVPPLGTRHGTLSHRRSVELFLAALDRAGLRRVQRVWFVVPEGFDPSALDLL